LYDEATRAGSRALLYNALIAFVTVRSLETLLAQPGTKHNELEVDSIPGLCECSQSSCPLLSKRNQIARLALERRKAGGDSLAYQSRV
jgi:hypothetical protein